MMKDDAGSPLFLSRILSNRIFPASASCIALILLLSSILPGYGQELWIDRSGEESNASHELKINLSENFRILEGASDLTDWQERLVFGPSDQQRTLPLPLTSIEQVTDRFFRLREVSPTGVVPSFSVSLSPVGEFLGRLAYGDEISFDLFGTRDAEGYPETIQNISCKLGNEILVSDVSEEPPPAHAAKAGSSNSGTVYGDVGVLGGYIYIQTDPGCRLPGLLPVLEFAAFDDAVGQRVTGFIPARLVHTEAEIDAFWYELPVLRTGDIQWASDEERALDAFLAGLRTILPSNPEELARESRWYAGSKDLVPKVIRRSFALYNAYEFVEGAAESWEETTMSHQLLNRSELQNVQVRAVIPETARNRRMVSKWVSYERNRVPFYPEGTGEPIHILVPCGEEIEIDSDEVEHRSGLNNLVKARVDGRTIYSNPVPETIDSSETSVTFENSQEGEGTTARSVVKIVKSLNSISAEFEASCSVPAESESNYTASAGIDQGNIVFSVPPNGDRAVGDLVQARLELFYSGPNSHAVARILREANNSQLCEITLETNSIPCSLRVGTRYRFIFGTGANARVGEPASIAGEAQIILVD